VRLVAGKVAVDRFITACICFPYHCYFTKASYPFTDLPRQATKPHQLRTSLNKHNAFFRQFQPLRPNLHVHLVLNIGLQIHYSNTLLLKLHRCSMAYVPCIMFCNTTYINHLLYTTHCRTNHTLISVATRCGI